jgi:hypothetical protein
MEKLLKRKVGVLMFDSIMRYVQLFKKEKMHEEINKIGYICSDGKSQRIHSEWDVTMEYVNMLYSRYNTFIVIRKNHDASCIADFIFECDNLKYEIGQHSFDHHEEHYEMLMLNETNLIEEDDE